MASSASAGAPRAKRQRKSKGDSASFAKEQENRLKSLGDNPVLSVTLKDDDDSPPPSFDMESPELLDQLLHPISRRAFLDDGFRKKALHFTGKNNCSRIESILEELQQLDPEHILTETSSDNVFVWLMDDKKKTIHSLEMQDPQQALALHQISGHATYCRAPPSVEQPMVANLLKGTGFGCGQYDPSGQSSISLGRGEVEVFIGTKAHTTEWHYDFQENFTIQLSGSKRWKLQAGTVHYPMRGCTPHYAAPASVESQLKAIPNDKFQFGTPETGVNAAGKVDEVTLLPGDVLYFPAGMWHHVTTVQPGVSINVSLMATNYATVACQALHHYLLMQPSHDGWRETIHNATSDSSTTPTVVTKLQGLLKQLPSIVQGFAETHGARAILPPVLTRPPDFQVPAGDDEEGWDEVEQNDSNNGDVGSDGDESKSDDGEQDEQSGKDEERHSVLGSTVVAVSTFKAPSDWSSEAPGPDYRLAVNPLAWIRPVEDVTKFYAGSKTKDDENDLYVININYAGNELHESAVRIVVRDEYGSPTDMREATGSALESREACYLYHGLYCWAKTEKKLQKK